TMQPRHFVPALSVVVGGSSLVAAVVDPRSLFVAIPLALAYLAGIVVSSVRIATQLGRKRLPSLLVAFPVLHFAYGTGFLLGLLRFLPRWWTREPPPPRLV
ncbi:MAG: hypothetical protein ACREQY_16990, partial [Candidatus Binatia bacterium]